MVMRWSIHDEVTVAGDPERRDGHSLPGKGGQELPVAIDVVVPVGTADKSGLNAWVRRSVSRRRQCGLFHHNRDEVAPLLSLELPKPRRTRKRHPFASY